MSKQITIPIGPVLSLIGGALFASSFPSKIVPSLFISGLLGITLFLSNLHIFTEESSYKRVFCHTLLFSIGFVLLGYYWLPETMHLFGSLPLPVGYLLTTLFSIFVLPQWFISLLTLIAIKRLLAKRNLKIPPTLIPLLFSTLITLAEITVPQQFPTHLGHSWLHLKPWLGVAPLLGEHGFSFFSYLIITTMLYSYHYRKINYIPTIAITLFLLINFSRPLVAPPSKAQLHLRLVQANIGSLMKVDAERGTASSFQEVYTRYEQLSMQESSKPLDLIVWPETAYPRTMYSKLLRQEEYMPPILKRIIKKHQAPMLIGGYDLQTDPQGFGSFNTAFLINTDNRLVTFYHKIKLIPFGEGLPFGPLNKTLKKYITNISYFSAGDKFTLFEINNFRFITPICYEILFPSFIKDYLNRTNKRPHFILNLTNDSWYGDTSEPYQHQFLAQWRAIEFQLPLVRMTNTGITSVTDIDGSQSRVLTPYQAAILDVNVAQRESTPPLYQRYGDSSLILIMLFLLTLQITLGLKPSTIQGLEQ